MPGRGKDDTPLDKTGNDESSLARLFVRFFGGNVNVEVTTEDVDPRSNDHAIGAGNSGMFPATWIKGQCHQNMMD